MIIGLFADPHYCTAEQRGSRRPRLSRSKLEQALRAFRDAGAQLLVCLGDLVDTDETPERDGQNLLEISGRIRSSGFRCLCCMGNHDRYLFDPEEFERLSGLQTAPFLFDAGGARIILLDANYRRDGVPYERRNIDWTDTAVAGGQAAFLREALRGCPPDGAYIFLHQNLDPIIPENHRAANAAEIREIIEAAGCVRTVVQGHYHPGADRVIEDVRYFTLRAMCEGEENAFALLDTATAQIIL